MAEPYVQFLINHVTKNFHEQSVAFAPDATPPAHPYDWKVVCDANGKIVVRALDKATHAPVVIATAVWRYAIVDPICARPNTPSVEQWALIESHLRPLLDSRASHASDPAAVDPGVVDVPAVAPAAPAMGSVAAPGNQPTGVVGGHLKNPYVEFILDYATTKPAPGSVHYAPDPTVLPASAFVAKVICDAIGKVVIRGSINLLVLGTAAWHDGKLDSRVVSKDGPNDNQWTMIEEALRGELATAVSSGARFDAEARDMGFVKDAVTAKPEKQGFWKTVLAVLALLLVIAGIVVYMYAEKWWKAGSVANGDSCTFDSDCGSKNCYHSTCRSPNYGNGNFSAGSRCDYSSECASHHCSRGVCQTR